MHYLDNARIFAILAVIALHVSGDFLVDSEQGGVNWWIANFFESVTRWCVPVFVMISGALLLDPRKQDSTKVFYKKRLHRIGIPLVFWSLFFLSWTAVRQWFVWGSVDFSLLWENLLLGTPYYHLWYLYMIIFLYLFSPLLKAIVKQLNRKELVFFTLVMFVLAALNTLIDTIFATNTDLFVFWFLSFIPYFMVGYLIRIDEKHYRLSFLISILIASIALTALGYFVGVRYFSLEMGQYFYKYLSVTLIPMSISVMYLFKKVDYVLISKVIDKKVASLVFAIYLIHPFYIDILGDLLKAYQLNASIAFILIAILVVFIMSLISALIISRMPLLNRTI